MVVHVLPCHACGGAGRWAAVRACLEARGTRGALRRRFGRGSGRGEDGWFIVRDNHLCSTQGGAAEAVVVLGGAATPEDAFAALTAHVRSRSSGEWSGSGSSALGSARRAGG
eukprot:scaffold4104_cov149-Isochrysis_galbana.AAC.1